MATHLGRTPAPARTGRRRRQGCTGGRINQVIHWARLYDAVFGRLLQSTDSKIAVLARVRAGQTALDVGCGPGHLAIALQQQAGAAGEVHGIDPSTEMIHVARRRASRIGAPVEFLVGTIEQLPYPDETFDSVVTRLVLHHLSESSRRQGFAELRRVLKPGGTLVVVEFMPPANHVLATLAFASIHFGRRVDIEDYAPLLSEHGFDEIETGRIGRSILGFARGQAPH